MSEDTHRVFYKSDVAVLYEGDCLKERNPKP